MLRAKSLLSKAWFCLLLTSCGYHWTPSSDRPTVAVSYANGDETGALTNEMIHALARSGLVEIRPKEAALRLEISVVKDTNETIGFRRDPQEIRGKIRKNLLACEGRRTLEVEATFFDTSTNQATWGPYRLLAEADYDYIDGDSIRDLAFTTTTGTSATVLPFSLGQLEPIESAQEASAHPLHVLIGKKLVDVISSEW